MTNWLLYQISTSPPKNDGRVNTTPINNGSLVFLIEPTFSADNAYKVSETLQHLSEETRQHSYTEIIIAYTDSYWKNWLTSWCREYFQDIAPIRPLPKKNSAHMNLIQSLYKPPTKIECVDGEIAKGFSMPANQELINDFGFIWRKNVVARRLLFFSHLYGTETNASTIIQETCTPGGLALDGLLADLHNDYHFFELKSNQVSYRLKNALNEVAERKLMEDISKSKPQAKQQVDTFFKNRDDVQASFSNIITNFFSNSFMPGIQTDAPDIKNSLNGQVHFAQYSSGESSWRVLVLLLSYKETVENARWVKATLTEVAADLNMLTGNSRDMLFIASPFIPKQLTDSLSDLKVEGRRFFAIDALTVLGLQYLMQKNVAGLSAEQVKRIPELVYNQLSGLIDIRRQWENVFGGW